MSDRFPDYDPNITAGDTVKPHNGGVFARAGDAKTAKVLSVRLYICPMEGPEWLAETTAGSYFTFVLEKVDA